jgi:LPPG:FO 2-phospho-L-lactate transferase
MSGTSKTSLGTGRVVALCGGVGGAKLALGLSRTIGDRLTIIVNTGDDFEHLGLQISPDLDTVLYTLSGLANKELGWGRNDESWNFMEVLGQLGSETWFRLGDRDLALHVERTRHLGAGGSLTSFMARMARQLGITAKILPMSDQPVRTTVHTADGPLAFQRYFVEQRCAPVVQKITFEGVEAARPTAEVTAALQDPDLSAIIIVPSNPFLSIDPILSVPGLRTMVENAGVPVVAMSPLIGGNAVKGPTGKIMGELGLGATSRSVEAHYGTLLDGLMIDTSDASDKADLTTPLHVTSILMKTDEDRDRLARETLEFADRIQGERRP